MRNIHIITIIFLVTLISGCSTFKKSDSSPKVITTDETAKSPSTVVDSHNNSQTSEKNTKEVLPKVIKTPPKDQTEIELDTNKAGSTANTEIPQENAYPLQTEKPRFSVIEETQQKDLDSTETEPLDEEFIFERVISGYQIDVIENEKIKKFRKYYLDNSDYVEKVLERSRPYLFFIVEEIEKRGMPMELALLPAIESAFLTSATSRSNAAGLWQFIPTTGRYFGLKQNWWSDQRRDVILSTQTALDYLKELNMEFNGDWYLSIAAYNGGRGTIRKAIKHNRKNGKPTDYFSLQLRKETSDYVPKLIALADIVRNAHLYNLTVPEIPNFPFFAQIKTPGQIDMARLIDETSLNKDVFHNLNAGFKRWTSSPEGPHRIVVPVNSSKTVKQYLASAPSMSDIPWRNHKLRKGDTLYGLSRKYNVSIKAIKTVNNLKSSLLRAGKTILIPLRSA